MINRYELIKKLDFRPEGQKGWFFYEWDYEADLTIDLSLSFYHKINITGNINIDFKNAKEGYLYILLLQVSAGKTITWKNGNNIYLRFASGTKYEENSGTGIDYIYLGVVATYKDDDNLYLDFIAIANEFEEIE